MMSSDDRMGLRRLAVAERSPARKGRDLITVDEVRGLLDTQRKLIAAEMEKMNSITVANFMNLSREVAALVSKVESDVERVGCCASQATDALSASVNRVLQLHAQRLRQFDDRMLGERLRRAWSLVRSAVRLGR